MVVTCHPAGVMTVWGQERTDGNKYGPEYYSARGENCPPRYDKDMEEFFSMGEEYSYIFRNGNWLPTNARV
ncbi:MAG: hypothetical protein CM15mV26_1070 [uncultured marine virus]|nr:MAG: hypothetical protein CM15mV26_1070 [uncultured marine virus]